MIDNPSGQYSFYGAVIAMGAGVVSRDHYHSDVVFGAVPCRGRVFPGPLRCSAAPSVPLGFTPVAVLCRECFCVHVVGFGPTDAGLQQHAAETARFTMGREHVLYRFPLRRYDRGGSTGLKEAWQDVERLREIISTNTRGKRVLQSGPAASAGSITVTALNRLDFEKLDSVREWVGEVLLKRAQSVRDRGVARSFAARAAVLDPTSSAAEALLHALMDA